MSNPYDPELIKQTLRLTREPDSTWFSGEDTPTRVLIDEEVWAGWDYCDEINVRLLPGWSDA